jgi:hypothetical protein
MLVTSFDGASLMKTTATATGLFLIGGQELKSSFVFLAIISYIRPERFGENQNHADLATTQGQTGNTNLRWL